MDWRLKITGLLISLAVIVSVGVVSLFSNQQSNDKVKFNLPRVKEGVTLAGKKVGGLNQIELTQKISQLAGELKVETHPAFRFQGQIKPGEPGKKINITATLVKTLQATAEKKVIPTYESVSPLIRQKHLAEKINFKLSTGESGIVLGHFTTYLTNNQSNRRTNIRLAAAKLTDFVLQPGEKFSFNQLIGTPDQTQGYQPAPVIIAGKLEPRVGGGICQVSSTLYSAVKKAKLKVLERHPHSQAINYIAPGQDAAIYPGQKDFRFKNDTAHKIKLKGQLIGRYLAIYLLQIQTPILNF